MNRITAKAALAVASAALCGQSDAGASMSPHILFMVVDDLGWNDISWHNPQIRSPRIHALAEVGVKLMNHHTFKWCSPSRSSIMTGRYPYHLGQQTNINMNPATTLPCGIHLSYDFIPKLLRSRGGYSTHALGKWHLGYFKPEYTPTFRGFDTFLGFYTGGETHYSHITPHGGPGEFGPGTDPNQLDGLCHGQQGLGCSTWTPEHGATHPPSYDGSTCYLFDLSNNSATTLMPANRSLNGTFSTELYVMEATRLIRQHAALYPSNTEASATGPSKPFYLYLAWHVVHMPLEAPRAALALQPNLTNPNRRTMLAMVTSLDTGVGQVVDALAEQDMSANSIIVLTTDNGGATNSGKYLDAGNNWPLRGSKCTEWQGGVRGVAMVSSPLLKDAVKNTSWDGMMHIVDWYPTVAKMALLPDSTMVGTGPVDVDGMSMWDAIQAGTASPRTEMVHNIDGKDEKGAWSGSIRVGELKLLVGFPGFPDGHVRPAGGGPGARSGWDAPEHAECSDCSPLESDPASLPCVAQPCLFNLSSDQYENYDLAAEQPALLRKMQAIYAKYKKSAVGKNDKYGICPPAPPGGWPDACAANKAIGYWQPWVTGDVEPQQARRISTTVLVVGGLIAAGAVIVIACVIKALCCRTRYGAKGRELDEPISS